MIVLTEINYLAVLLATVTTMLLGFLWYSPILFGNSWVKEIGLKMEDMSGGSPFTYFLTALTALVGAFVLAFLITLYEEKTMMSGMLIGLLIGISISAKIGMNFIFENKSRGLYFITIGYHLVSYVVMGVIISLM